MKDLDYTYESCLFCGKGKGRFTINLRVMGGSDKFKVCLAHLYDWLEIMLARLESKSQE